ncbi:SpoIID/LytB domain-containing protein [Metabacillus idriensis]|uniref:SpoIID/LytB domain-containing protein n=1 Tax=Metabacillus idriensis TaxID=324768 RepID=UPI00174D7D39|nr:SpoIID/LytB domain-containing protein [Metabacillus idriensis]
MNKAFMSIVALTLFFLFAEENAFAANSNPSEVSVNLKHYVGNAKEVTVQVEGEYYLAGENDFKLKNGHTYKVKNESGRLVLYNGSVKNKSLNSSAVFLPVKYGTENYMKINGRSYLGTMKFKVENSQYVRPENELPLEDYLKGVVPGEMYPSWPVEALKAQSVSARTYALKRINQTIDDTVSFQKYEGYIWNKSSYANTNEAVNRTKGQVLKMNGNLIEALYSSSNGGKTENNANVWTSGTPLSYFPAKTDPYDPRTPWKISVNENQLDPALLDLTKPADWWSTVKEKDVKYSNNIKTWLKTDKNFTGKDIKIVKVSKLAVSNEKTSGDRRKTGSYRIEFYVKNANGTYQMKDGKIETVVKEGTNVNITALRSMFGTVEFKSHLIDSLTVENGVYTFKGRGFGHGVGMSQYGAKAMSDQKQNYMVITNFYYPGTNYDNYIGQAVEEIEGADRYETSAAIAEFGWASANTVFIGRGDNPVDALTGSVLAKKYNAPLLLSNPTQLSDSVKQTLANLNPANIYILGGKSAISDSVEAELKGIAANVHRISGSERYDTAAAVAKQVGHSGSIFITSDSSDSPDALSIASYAAAEQMPILYTKADTVPKAVANYISGNGVRKVTIVGGETAVSAKVQSQLEALVGAGNVDRVYGKDRYETSVNIVKKYNLDNRKVFFARGTEFIDALPGSVLAANDRAPIILVEKDAVPLHVSSYIYDHMTFIPHIHYLGGKGAISEQTRSSLQNWFLQ